MSDATVSAVLGRLGMKRRRGALLLLAVALAAQLRGFLSFERAMKRTGGPGIIQFELAGTTDRARAILDRWGPAGQAAARKSLLLDYAFPPSYALFQALACDAIAVGLAARSRSFMAGVGLPIAWAQLAAAGFDYVENTALLVMLAGRDQRAPRVARRAALLKFALISLGQSYIVVGGIDAQLCRLRK